jgi:predicted aspartyl protease
MPHLNLQISANGPVMDVMVGVSAARREALQKGGQAVPAPVSMRALIDTGASCTCIDPSVLGQLSLTPTGATQIHTPSTGSAPHTLLTYDASLTLVHPRLQLQITTVAVVATELEAQGIQALIGRDILENCLLIYNGQEGTFTLAF